MSGVKLTNVSKIYQEGEFTTKALDNISLNVDHGEFVAIIAPSRSGKSTFLSISGALLQASEGEVLIDDVDVSSLSEKKLSEIRLSKIGFILQTSNLLPYLTVTYQLLVVKKMSGSITDADRELAKELLTEIGLGKN